MTGGARPRLLVLTPDFPPAFGGIQLLVSRLVESFERFDVRVVALDQPGAESLDRASDLEVVRTPQSSIPKASNLLLNAGAVRDAIRFRPDVVLGAHIIVAPAAALIQRVARAPFVQYLHGNEVAARPRLARFAVKSAAASIAVSSYTGRLATDVGADQARVHRIPPGVDLPVLASGGAGRASHRADAGAADGPLQGPRRADPGPASDQGLGSRRCLGGRGRRASARRARRARARPRGCGQHRL